MVQLIYPERRLVSEETIISWAKDQLIDDVIGAKAYEDDVELSKDFAEVERGDLYKHLTLESAIDLLEDRGLITVQTGYIPGYEA